MTLSSKFESQRNFSTIGRTLEDRPSLLSPENVDKSVKISIPIPLMMGLGFRFSPLF